MQVESKVISSKIVSENGKDKVKCKAGGLLSTLNSIEIEIKNFSVKFYAARVWQNN